MQPVLTARVAEQFTLGPHLIDLSSTTTLSRPDVLRAPPVFHLFQGGQQHVTDRSVTQTRCQQTVNATAAAAAPRDTGVSSLASLSPGPPADGLHTRPRRKLSFQLDHFPIFAVALSVAGST